MTFPTQQQKPSAPTSPDAKLREMSDSEYIREHRIVAAMTEGRPLTQAEVVHHINGEKMDNRPENLVALCGR